MSSSECPYYKYYMWQGKKIYDCEFQSKVDDLLKTLQQIKAIVKGVRGYLEVPAPRDVRYEMDRILDLITKAESEG